MRILRILASQVKKRSGKGGIGDEGVVMDPINAAEADIMNEGCTGEDYATIGWPTNQKERPAGALRRRLRLEEPACLAKLAAIIWGLS